MLSDVEITGYREPLPSPESIDLTQEAKRRVKRQRSLLKFASDSPGPLGTAPKSPWPVFLQRFTAQLSGETWKRLAWNSIEEPADESSKDDFSQPPAAEWIRLAKLQNRCLKLVGDIAFTLCNSSCKSLDVATVATKLKLPRSILETRLNKLQSAGFGRTASTWAHGLTNYAQSIILCA